MFVREFLSVSVSVSVSVCLSAPPSPSPPPSNITSTTSDAKRRNADTTILAYLSAVAQDAQATNRQHANT